MESMGNLIILIKSYRRFCRPFLYATGLLDGRHVAVSRLRQKDPLPLYLRMVGLRHLWYRNYDTLLHTGNVQGVLVQGACCKVFSNGHSERLAIFHVGKLQYKVALELCEHL